MPKFLAKVRAVNSLLYWFGWIMWTGAFISVVLIIITNSTILGINAWIKPMKFFISVAIMTWTMGYLMQWLDRKKPVRIYSWVLVITMGIELLIISMQSARGQQSHFNVSSALNGMLFGVMGAAIVIFTVWTAFVCFLFFQQKNFNIPDTLVWGIRLGLLFFVFFASEGGVMVEHLAHTVGAPDGGPGLPFVNWSKQHGDLRISHFFGMHALQIIPLYAYYFAKSVRSVIIFSVLYLMAILFLLVLALKGLPLISF